MNDFEKKDVLIKYLIENFDSSRKGEDPNELIDVSGFDYYRLRGVLEDFKEKGFIDFSYNKTYFYIELKEPIFDFIKYGGYSMQFHLMETQYHKLLAEIKVLEEKFGLKEIESLISVTEKIGKLLAVVYA